MNPQGNSEAEDSQHFTVSDEVKTKELDGGLLGQIADETQRKELTGALVEQQKFELNQRRAKMFSVSGLFEDTKNVTPGSQVGVARAMVKIELGASMGFSAAEALQGIHVINGQTAISSALRAGRMQAAGYDWEIQWHGSETACTGCTLWLLKDGKPLLVHRRDKDGNILFDQDGNAIVDQAHVSFLESDAKRMMTTQWVNNQKQRVSILEKDNWKMSPRNMYFARAVTNAQRFYAPKVLSVSLMSVEEAEDIDLDRVADMTLSRETGSRDAQKDVLSRKLAEIRKPAPEPTADAEKPQPLKSEPAPPQQSSPAPVEIQEEPHAEPEPPSADEQAAEVRAYQERELNTYRNLFTQANRHPVFDGIVKSFGATPDNLPIAPERFSEMQKQLIAEAKAQPVRTSRLKGL